MAKIMIFAVTALIALVLMAVLSIKDSQRIHLLEDQNALLQDALEALAGLKEETEGEDADEVQRL